MCDTLNCSQECCPVRRGKERKQQLQWEERDSQTDGEDRPVWQVCVTVHTHHAKLM